MSGAARRVREEMAQYGRVRAGSLAAALAEVYVGEAGAYVDERTHPRLVSALQEAAAVLAVLDETVEQAQAVLAAELEATR